MKAPRSIQRAIRISNFVFKKIDEYQGDNWNDKLNNFLEFYIQNEIEYKKYLKELENQIEEKQQLLEEFKLKITKFQDLLK